MNLKRIRCLAVILFAILVWFSVSPLIKTGEMALASPFTSSRFPETMIHDAGFLRFLQDPPADLKIPATIRVRMTRDYSCDPAAPYVVKTIDFKTYVKHVLPFEWAPAAKAYPEVLRAGAIAVKMYAWYWISLGGKWPDADVASNVCDQVYNPNVTYLSTNQAVDYTWNWVLLRDHQLFQTHHLQSCKPPICMGQQESLAKAQQGYSWDEILNLFYPGSELVALDPPPAGFSLRFNGQPGDGNGGNRIEIPLVQPGESTGSSPMNFGGQDFTMEWWMKSSAAENQSETIACGTNQNWTYGNILFDRSRDENGSELGVSLAGGKIAFGITGPDQQSMTLCSRNVVTDNRWHHIAVQRRQQDGTIWMYVDGKLDTSVNGPAGNIQFTSSHPPSDQSVGASLSIGGWNQDTDSGAHPFFRGWLDELRVSNVLRYPLSRGFPLPTEAFLPDEDTLVLYHFDEGYSTKINNAAGTDSSLGQGQILYGGQESGPEWEASSLFLGRQIYLPLVTQ